MRTRRALWASSRPAASEHAHQEAEQQEEAASATVMQTSRTSAYYREYLVLRSPTASPQMLKRDPLRLSDERAEKLRSTSPNPGTTFLHTFNASTSCMDRRLLLGYCNSTGAMWKQPTLRLHTLRPHRNFGAVEEPKTGEGACINMLSIPMSNTATARVRKPFLSKSTRAASTGNGASRKHCLPLHWLNRLTSRANSIRLQQAQGLP